MCEGCHTAICYEGCPFYEPDDATLLCEVCGGPIEEDGAYYQNGERVLCEGCAEGLSLDDALDLFGLCGIGDLLAHFGYRRA